MRDIKVKHIDRSIKEVDKKATLEHFEKQVDMNTKDKQSCKNDTKEEAPSSPNQQAVNKVIRREKTTAVESAYRAEKYVKNKYAKRNSERSQAIKTKENIRSATDITSLQKPESRIKQKTMDKKDRTLSSKLKSLSYRPMKKNHYSSKKLLKKRLLSFVKVHQLQQKQ